MLLLLALCSGAAPAAAAEPAHQAGHEGHLGGHVHPAAAPPGAEVGLDERLGATIPLDLIFRDEEGKAITLRELVTVPTVIAPVYFHCPNVCSFLQGGLARALPAVKRAPGEDFRVISVSFDETETPEDARRARAIYMDAMGGRFPEGAWRFLTGDPQTIRRLTDAAGYRFQRQGKDFLHPVAIFVVTPQGEIVRYLHGTSILPMDLTLALVEASEGRIGPTIRKVAQFCFSYDPAKNRYVFNLFRVSAAVILLTAGSFMAYLILKGRKRSEGTREL